MFRPAIVLYIRDPTSSDTGKQRLVRERPKKRRPTEVSVSYSGSPGAVGRHNNTPNRVVFDAGAVSTPHPVRALALRGARPTHRTAKIMEAPSILQTTPGPPLLELQIWTLPSTE
jgi:hypothetical protein